MVGIGIDAVEVARFREVMARRPRLVERAFSRRERDQLAGRADPVPSFAARFAAKEALMKALGVGLGAVGLREVEVVRDDTGAPHLELSGRAALLAQRRGVQGLFVSLTHTATTASAVVLAS